MSLSSFLCALSHITRAAPLASASARLYGRPMPSPALRPRPARLPLCRLPAPAAARSCPVPCRRRRCATVRRAAIGHAHRHPVSGPRELDGVGEQVEEHLLEGYLVGDDARRSWSDRRHTSSSPAWSASGRATARQLATMHAGSRSVNASSGRPAGGGAARQHAVHDSQRMPRAVIDIARVLAIARIAERPEMLVLEHFRIGDHGAQRCSQFMRQLRGRRHLPGCRPRTDRRRWRSFVEASSITRMTNRLDRRRSRRTRQ